MAQNGERPATGHGEQGAGVRFQADARKNTTPTYRVQGDLVVIREMTKNRREGLRIALDRFRGVDLVDVRVTVDLTESSHIQTPTKKGVSLRIEQLPELIDALTEARDEAERLGLLQGSR